jgi:SAM-dependent methyltransferase
MDMLPQEDLIKTSDLDQGAWSYSGLLGWVSRRRLHLVTELLEADVRAPGDLLEIGYGSGLFMPALTRFATRLHGVDPHPHSAEVTDVLARHGVTADLHTGSATDLPFDDASMDTVVCISALEFVDELEQACLQIQRVLRPGGRLVVITPGHSRLLDLGLQALTGERAEDTFQGRRQRIIPTLERHFTRERMVSMPPRSPAATRLYAGILLRRG